MPEIGDFVIPGDMIGTSEEFLPGQGTYEDNGNIYAITTGRVAYNKKERSISITPVTNTPPTPKEGDIVIGQRYRHKGIRSARRASPHKGTP